jgi:hypothetical protein
MNLVSPRLSRCPYLNRDAFIPYRAYFLLTETITTELFAPRDITRRER